MTRARSPGYPSMSLKEAIQRTHKIFQSDRQNPIDRNTAAILIGYKGPSGASDKAIGALGHYGLVERIAKGEMRVSKLAVDLMYPENDNEKRRALKEAFENPELFSRLRERFPDVPSEESLKGYLRREGFIENAVNQVASSYLDSCQLLEQEGAYDFSVPPSEEVSDSEEVQSAAVFEQPSAPVVSKGIEPMHGERILKSGMLSKQSTFKLIVDGPVSVKEIDRLIAQLEIDKDILADDESVEGSDLH